MYYIMRANPFYERGILDDPKLPEGVSFLSGNRIHWIPEQPLVFRSNCDAQNPPRHYMDALMPVWSSELLDSFREAGVNNIQAFPAIITEDAFSSIPPGDGGGREWSNYFAINILDPVSSIKVAESQELLLLFKFIGDPLQIIVHDQLMQQMRKTAPPVGWGITLYDLDKMW